jgi:hypothetical protein
MEICGKDPDGVTNMHIMLYRDNYGKDPSIRDLSKFLTTFKNNKPVELEGSMSGVNGNGNWAFHSNGFL